MTRLQQRALGSVLAGVSSLILLAPSATQAQRVLSDQELLIWARDTYERHDYVYSAIHLNALIQRKVPAVANSPTLSKEVRQALAYSIERLEDNKRNAAKWEQELVRRAEANREKGVGVSGQLLSAPPPAVNWPVPYQQKGAKVGE